MNQHSEGDDKKLPVERLCFMLSQLRDDLDEIITGLETGAIPYHFGVEGAKVQLNWALGELGKEV